MQIFVKNAQQQQHQHQQLGEIRYWFISYENQPLYTEEKLKKDSEIL